MQKSQTMGIDESSGIPVEIMIEPVWFEPVAWMLLGAFLALSVVVALRWILHLLNRTATHSIER